MSSVVSATLGTDACAPETCANAVEAAGWTTSISVGCAEGTGSAEGAEGEQREREYRVARAPPCWWGSIERGSVERGSIERRWHRARVDELALNPVQLLKGTSGFRCSALVGVARV